MAHETRVEIIEAAERLFAQHGMAGVSLREIIAAAGQRHKAAVRYHFGSKQRLIEEILNHRVDVIDRHRSALLMAVERDADGDCLRRIVEAQVRPLFDLVQPGSYWARFLAHLFQDAAYRHAVPADAPSRAAGRRIARLLRKALPEIPTGVLVLRRQAAWRLVIQEIAVHERELAAGRRKAASSAALARGLVDMVVGILSAPVSPTRRRPAAVAGDGSASSVPTGRNAGVHSQGHVRQRSQS
ncbi:MAG: TetR family transcriptional regulator [Candidatus Binatia bacterium]